MRRCTKIDKYELCLTCLPRWCVWCYGNNQVPIRDNWSAVSLLLLLHKSFPRLFSLFQCFLHLLVFSLYSLFLKKKNFFSTARNGLTWTIHMKTRASLGGSFGHPTLLCTNIDWWGNGLCPLDKDYYFMYFWHLDCQMAGLDKLRLCSYNVVSQARTLWVDERLIEPERQPNWARVAQR